MIFFGYLGLALVLGVGSALLALVVSQASSGARLFMRCLRWGVATGAVTGRVVGASLPLIGSLTGDTGSLLGFMFGGVVYGAVIGAVVALIPSLIGASAGRAGNGAGPVRTRTDCRVVEDRRQRDRTFGAPGPRRRAVGRRRSRALASGTSGALWECPELTAKYWWWLVVVRVMVLVMVVAVVVSWSWTWLGAGVGGLGLVVSLSE